MRPLPRVLLFGTLAAILSLPLPVLGADPRPLRLDFGETKWPAHPTLLFAKYRGTRFPVIAVDKDRPVILVDGKRKTLSASNPLTTQLAEDFSPAQVQFTGQIAIGKRKWVTPPQRGAHIPDSTEMREYTGTLTLESPTDVPDAYVLITYFDREAMEDPGSDSYCKSALIEIGTLRANESRVVPLSMTVHMPLRVSSGNLIKDYFGRVDETLVIWQLFSQGREIRTNDLRDIEIRHSKRVYSKDSYTSLLEVTGAGQFIYLRERLDHADALQTWRKENKKSTRAAQPYARTPLPAGPTAEFPPEASALLSVSAEGKVTEVALEPALPEDAAKRLTSYLRLWLFLPAIKDGSAVKTQVRVPLAL